jgi:NAD(P)-dependent dehydrogenase (short-subunit alcohol dehydrogenase family)
MADVLPARYPLLTISRQLRNLSWARSPEPVVNCASPIGSDIAYAMFTSGTTGRPKGVPVKAESLDAYLDVATKRFGVRRGDRASHFFELTFDLSVHDIFVTLTDEAAVTAVLAAVPDRSDGVVHAAGVAGGGPVHLLDRADWDRVIGINLTGTFLIALASFAACWMSG